MQETFFRVIFRNVAFRAEGDQICRPIRLVILPVAEMVDLQYFPLCAVLAARVLTFMMVAVQDVFPQVPETVLLALLVIRASNRWIFDLLDVKTCHFDCCFHDR